MAVQLKVVVGSDAVRLMLVVCPEQSVVAPLVVTVASTTVTCIV